MDEKTILLRLGLAVLFGVIIGLEREHKNKDAGATTHALVALAAALLVIISKEGFKYAADGMLLSTDGSRVAASIIPGIGFLGAGAIIVRGDRVSGLTTSAGILITAAIGMGFGSGLYMVAATAAVLVFVVLVGTRMLDTVREHRMAKRAAQRDKNKDPRQYDHEQDTEPVQKHSEK